jgi:HD-GYP domain-containing protein (c-di-GMP phosphodiesterase class II)
VGGETDRPYRAALPWEWARAELLRHAGTQWEPSVVNAFVTLIDAEESIDAQVRLRVERVLKPA